MRGITVCVDYWDYLSITLPRNAQVLEEIVVVTHPRDIKTQKVCLEIPNVRCFLTDAFYRNGGDFRKWLALEEGMDSLGREGWICVFDADTMLPSRIEEDFEVGRLYSPCRRMIQNACRFADGVPWSSFPKIRDREFSGYCLIFHANDPVLEEKPWFQTFRPHAGGGDSAFERKWSEDQKIRPSFEVLHLGSISTNWYGRVSRFLDGSSPEGFEDRRHKMERLVYRYRIRRSHGRKGKRT